VCTNAASRARDSDPRFEIYRGGHARPACILTARATSREPIAFLWSAPRGTMLARRRYAAPMQGRGRWVIHHRGAELIHGFLELHRHRLQGAQPPQRARARFYAAAGCIFRLASSLRSTSATIASRAGCLMPFCFAAS
jgi:hypothetical protein